MPCAPRSLDKKSGDRGSRAGREGEGRGPCPPPSFCRFPRCFRKRPQREGKKKSPEHGLHIQIGMTVAF